MALSLATMQDLTATVVVDFDRKVASGGYGDVYKGRLTREVDGHSGEVAVKVTRFIFANVPEKAMKGIKQELDIWQQHRHPYILPLIGVYFHQGVPCAVSPWCAGGTIIQYIKSARGGHEPELDAPVTNCDFDLLRLHCLEMKLLSQVAAGLAYLHAYNLAHGDIKASNILVKGGVAQLGDFGFSVFLAEHTGSTSSHLGTARWFAPESLQEKAHRTQEADVWAFGCAMLEVRTLLVPYHRVPDAAVSLAIRKDRPFERPKDIHPSLWSMAEACWSRSLKARIASPTLASRIKATLKYVNLMRKALGPLPDIRLLDLGYPNSNWTARFSLASVLLKRDNESSLDLTLAVATARNALRALDAPGKRYPPSALRSTIRLIAITSPQLAERLMQKLSTPALHSAFQAFSAVRLVVFLQDGRRLVSLSEDKKLRVWDITTGRSVLGPLEAHYSGGSCLAAYGSHIASCMPEGLFHIWDSNTGAILLGPINACCGDPRPIYAIAYSSDGSMLATGGYDNRCAIWSTSYGALLHDLVGHPNIVTCVAFSPDGTRLVSSSDTTIRIWDVAAGQCIGHPFEHGWYCSITLLSWSPDSTRIISSSFLGAIQIWDAETKALIAKPVAAGYSLYATNVAVSPDGKRVVFGSDEGDISMWNIETRALVQSPFKKHGDRVKSLVFSPDGRKIASASEDTTITLWDATDDWKRYDIGEEDVGGDDD